jgi:hypothetical protein
MSISHRSHNNRNLIKCTPFRPNPQIPKNGSEFIIFGISYFRTGTRRGGSRCWASHTRTTRKPQLCWMNPNGFRLMNNQPQIASSVTLHVLRVVILHEVYHI